MNNISLAINNCKHPIQLTANNSKIIFYYQLNQIVYSTTNKICYKFCNYSHVVMFEIQP